MSDAKTVGACGRCGKVGGDDWEIGAAGYMRRWTDVAALCDVCCAALQVWASPPASQPCGHCYHDVDRLNGQRRALECCQCGAGGKS